MITLRTVRRALVPVDSGAAARISGPNYDEFQDDAEIQALIADRPDSVLRVTMAHCDVPLGSPLLPEGSPEALERAARNMRRLEDGPLTREVADTLWVYEIRDPSRPAVRQIGLGGMGRVAEIRTSRTPDGPIIRNEGVREAKARGRAELIEATGAIIGTVNNAIDDVGNHLSDALERVADGRDPDLEVVDAHGSGHRIWLIGDPELIRELQALLAAEPRAYVADGNHRSAAAAMLGHEGFLTVFFPKRTMGIRPYNRLVRTERLPADIPGALSGAFEVEVLGGREVFQPRQTHEIGVYARGVWYRLRPRAGTWDPGNAAEDIDADIVQRHLFAAVLDIHEAGDPRLRFVGSNRDAAYLRSEVDDGNYQMAVTLPAVTMQQFVDVCLQGRMMPPKSTWFEPKIRSGLVMALL